jgi:hypothetical protein
VAVPSSRVSLCMQLVGEGRESEVRCVGGCVARPRGGIHDIQYRDLVHTAMLDCKGD